jgi:aryl-alcohol dehydrogenase-like predicted oxidoreductase
MVYGTDEVDEPTSIKIVERALNVGINFFDTADVYFGGQSEEIVGKALKKKGHSAVLATKVGPQWGLALHNLARFDCIEPPYNLLTWDIEYELLPLCANEGVGVCVYSPIASELLSGRHEFGKPPAEERFTLDRLGPL